ncbi:Chitin synthase 4 [Coemansia sp. RSA 2336]|nr:Chitin synthase 4 [Coemansia sp. RSA 2336]
MLKTLNSRLRPYSTQVSGDKVQRIISQIPIPKPQQAISSKEIVPSRAILEKAFSQAHSQTKLSISSTNFLTLVDQYIEATQEPESATEKLAQWHQNVLDQFDNNLEDIALVSKLLDTISRNKVMSLALYKVAADKGNHEGAFRLAKKLLEEGNGQNEAFSIITYLADNNHPDSMIYKAQAYMASKQYHIRARGIELLKQVNSPQASFMLGEAYRKTNVVRQDVEEAKRWHVRAAKGGVPASYFVLGNMLSKGLGTKNNKPDLPGALKMFELGAAAGHAESQYNAGMCYLQGTGTTKNADMAVDYLVLAAAQKFPVALLNLGKLFLEGAEVQRRVRRGRNYLHIAKECTKGVGDGFIGQQADMVLEKYAHLKDEKECVIL